MTEQDIMECKLFHLNSGCEYSNTGVRVNKQYRVRRNGMTKRWKRKPTEFKIPVKFGLYQYGYIDNTNVELWHCWYDCPLLTERERDEIAESRVLNHAYIS